MYDIYISYKRGISIATANNLYYRLLSRGYSVFFDLDEMKKDNFDEQIFKHIKEAKDVFVILEEGSLKACQNEYWQKDWFCQEISYALQEKKNIIPTLVNGYKMPEEDFFPEELKGLRLKNALEFSFAYFDEYLDKLIKRGYITAKPQNENVISILKFFSNEDCEVQINGKTIFMLNSKQNEPHYFQIYHKGDYLFRAVNPKTNEIKYIEEYIDKGKETTINIEWNKSVPIIIRRIKSIIQRSRLSSMLAFIIAVIAFFMISFVVGCGVGLYENRYDINDYKDITSYVFMKDSTTILYKHKGIEAFLNITTNVPRTDDRKAFKVKYASASDFILATTVSKSILSIKSLKLLKYGGGNWRSKLVTFIASFIGTICGYSFGKQYGVYIQRSDFEEDMKDLLKKPETWAPAIEKMKQGNLLKEPKDELLPWTQKQSITPEIKSVQTME